MTDADYVKAIHVFATKNANARAIDVHLTPANGKALDNPQFTNGGPDRHMLVIIGYDKKNGEFITNDPGTRLGRGYKYKDSTLYNAIRDYETGHKKDIEGMKKTVIVIKK
jgi:hypothetical protein